MLQLFVKTLTADHMYSPHSWKNSLQLVQTQVSWKWKTGSQSFIAFWKSTRNHAQIEEKKRSTWNLKYFRSYWLWKMCLLQCQNSSCFRTPFKSQSVHRSQTLLKYARNSFCRDFPLIEEKLTWQASPWIRYKMERLFVNTLTPDHVYSPHSWEKFAQPVQMQLS